MYLLQKIENFDRQNMFISITQKPEVLSIVFPWDDQFNKKVNKLPSIEESITAFEQMIGIKK